MHDMVDFEHLDFIFDPYVILLSLFSGAVEALFNWIESHLRKFLVIQLKDLVHTQIFVILSRITFHRIIERLIKPYWFQTIIL